MELLLIGWLFTSMVSHWVKSNGATLNGDAVVWITVDFCFVPKKYKYIINGVK